MTYLVEKRQCIIAMVNILGWIFWEHLTPKRILFLLSTAVIVFIENGNQPGFSWLGWGYICFQGTEATWANWSKKVLHFGNHARSEWSGVQWSLIQLLSRVRLFATPWTVAHQAFLSSTISWSLLKFMSIELVTLSNHLILCCPILLPSIFPSIRGFSNELALHIRWPKYWSFSFSISPSYEYSGLISFRIDWFDLLAVQGTLKSLLQYHNEKTSILWLPDFFMSNSHICTWLLEKP